VLDSLYGIIKPEMQGELNRWAPGNTKWEHNVQVIRDFLMTRPAVLGNQMYDYLPFVTAIKDPSQAHFVTAYPNPFNDRITVHISSEGEGHVNIIVLGEDGRMITTLFSGNMAGNEEYITWDGNDMFGHEVRPGLYILHVSTASQSYFLKIIRK
jgi:hypothetical protein